MTQQELAERTGVSRQTIISLESGKYIPSLDLAFRIALTFNKNIEDVFEYRPPQEPDPEWDSFSDYSDWQERRAHGGKSIGQLIL